LQTTAPCIRYSASGLCQSVAEQLHSELALYKHSSEKGAPCQLLIIGRSIDLPAALVHEFTYEAMAYDLLDGEVLDVDQHIVTMRNEVSSPRDNAMEVRRGNSYKNKVHKHSADEAAQNSSLPREVLLSESDTLWERLKHSHIQAVREELQSIIDTVLRENPQHGAAQTSTGEMLSMLRKTPELKDTLEKLNVHQFLVSTLQKRLEDHHITEWVGSIEQDIACGVDKYAKEVPATRMGEALSKVVGRMEGDQFSEVKLRLLMLYFACVANITEAVRTRMLDMCKLKPADHICMLRMLETKLTEVPGPQRQKLGTSCVHRGTKEQMARFKRNMKMDGRFELSRFEPRVKELLEQLAEQRLSEEEFPAVPGSVDSSGGRETQGLRVAGLQCTGGVPPTIDDWAFTAPAGSMEKPAPEPGLAGKCVVPAEVSQRLIVFVLGGVTHSELRSAAEVAKELPRGTEVLAGGTSLLTPRKLIQALRDPADASRDAARFGYGCGQDVLDLT